LRVGILVIENLKMRDKMANKEVSAMDEPKSPVDGDSSSRVYKKIINRVVAISLVVGLAGGMGGGWLIAKYGPTQLQVDRRSVILQDSSAIIDVVKNVSPSIVSITTESTGYGLFGLQTSQTGAGTGIIVDSSGLILTNNHVVSGQGATFSVFTSDGKEYKDAKVIATDPTRDIAFVKISAKGLKPAVLGDSSNLRVGARVIAIGNALGQFQNSATEGIISGLGRPIRAGDKAGVESLANLIQTDAAINPGNSGGPLVNISGQVIGMNTAIAGQAQNIGFAIPINEAKSALESVKTKGKITRPYLGVHYVDITPQFAEANNLKQTGGAYIFGDRNSLAVLPDSPASKAGLQDGDVIVKINNDTIDKDHPLISLVTKFKVGDKVTLTYIRDGQTKTVSVTLAEAPSN
jgi:serine protease Do